MARERQTHMLHNIGRSDMREHEAFHTRRSPLSLLKVGGAAHTQEPIEPAKGGRGSTHAGAH